MAITLKLVSHDDQCDRLVFLRISSPCLISTHVQLARGEKVRGQDESKGENAKEREDDEGQGDPMGAFGDLHRRP